MLLKKHRVKKVTFNINCRLAKALVGVISICCFILQSNVLKAQAEKNILDNINKATSDSERIVYLGKLANYYFKHKQENKADSIIEKQLMLAEEARNTDLVALVLFNNPRYNFPASSSKNISTKSYNYITRALDFAKREGLNDKAALAYSNLSELYLSEGRMEDAYRNANFAYATAQTVGNDSVLVITALQLGRVYENRSESLMAFRTYTNAFDIANHKQNPFLLSAVYHSISNLYKRLEQIEVAKSYIFKSLEVNKQNSIIEGQLKDYIALGKLSDYDMSIAYAQRTEALANSVKNDDYVLQAQKIIFNQKLVEKDPATAFEYLNQHPALVDYYKNTGLEYFNWVIGEVYLYGKKADEALPYFKKAEAAFDNGYDINSKKSFYEEFGQCYKQLNKLPLALDYYHQSLNICKAIGDLKGTMSLSKELKNLYAQQNNYKQALLFSNQYEVYEDSVTALARERDMAILEIDNERKRRAKEEELAEIQEDRRHNLQYMAITLVVATTFVLLITIGMFKVHKHTIRILGFLSFIFLFEFVLMLLEKVIHNITHGEPWKVWLIKIALVSFIFPLHHYLEEHLIHYLMSRKLIEMRRRYSISKLLPKRKKNSNAGKNDEAEISVTTSPFT